MTIERRHRLRLRLKTRGAAESTQYAYHKTSTEELHRRLDYVLTCIARPSDSQSLKFAISEVACRRKEFPAPSVTTVCRWVHLYYVSGAPTSCGRPLLGPRKERALRLHTIYEE